MSLPGKLAVYQHCAPLYFLAGFTLASLSACPNGLNSFRCKGHITTLTFRSHLGRFADWCFPGSVMLTVSRRCQGQKSWVSYGAYPLLWVPGPLDLVLPKTDPGCFQVLPFQLGPTSYTVSSWRSAQLKPVLSVSPSSRIGLRARVGK